MTMLAGTMGNSKSEFRSTVEWQTFDFVSHIITQTVIADNPSWTAQPMTENAMEVAKEH